MKPTKPTAHAQKAPKAGDPHRRVSPAPYLLATCLLVTSLLAACAFPGSVPPTVKVSLSAPFEGRHRDLGYEALHAVRLAVRERNAAGGIAGRYRIEFVALNDFNDPAEAVVQARKMAVDEGVLGVLGGWSPPAAQAAGAEYARLGLAFLAPPLDFTAPEAGEPPPSDPAFAAAYEELSGGAPPGPAAVWAYAAANRLLDALDAAAQAGGHPSRKGVQAILRGQAEGSGR